MLGVKNVSQPELQMYELVIKVSLCGKRICRKRFMMVAKDKQEFNGPEQFLLAGLR